MVRRLLKKTVKRFILKEEEEETNRGSTIGQGGPANDSGVRRILQGHQCLARESALAIVE